MKAVIHAAGIGSRMRPHTYTTPKILMKLGEKAIIDYIIDELIEVGVDEILMVLNPEGERIREHLSGKYPVKSKFVFQKELKGIAHAISIVSNELTDEPVLIILGDTIFEGNIKESIRSGYSFLCVKEVENPEKFGVVILDDEGFVKRLVEKPDKFVSNLALIGLYFIRSGKTLRDSIDYILENNITTKGEYQITDAIQDMINRGEKMKVLKIENWYDCGNPENILSSNRYILKRFSEKTNVAGSTIIDPCYISPKAKVIKSVIGPYVTIGNGTSVINSIIRDSIIGENTNIDNMILKDSIIGNNVVIRDRESSLNIGDSSIITF